MGEGDFYHVFRGYLYERYKGIKNGAKQLFSDAHGKNQAGHSFTACTESLRSVITLHLSQFD